MIKIISRDTDKAYLATCENCGQNVLCRPTMAVGPFGENRGYYTICFDCFKPRVTWIGDRGQFTSIDKNVTTIKKLTQKEKELAGLVH